MGPPGWAQLEWGLGDVSRGLRAPLFLPQKSPSLLGLAPFACDQGAHAVVLGPPGPMRAAETHGSESGRREEAARWLLSEMVSQSRHKKRLRDKVRKPR